MSERAFLITSQQLEYIAACLRRMEEARNRLKATTSEHLEVCDELSKCTTSMYELLSRLPAIPE